MAIPGRKPNPTAQKRLAGNPGHRPPNDREPEVEPALLEPPPHLNEEARKEWKRVAGRLYKAKIITELDRAALTGYCQWWAESVRISDHLEKLGPVIVSKKTGQPYLSPWLSALSMAMKQMQQFAAELGLTPSSRSRIKVSGDPPEDDPLLALMRRRQEHFGGN